CLFKRSGRIKAGCIGAERNVRAEERTGIGLKKIRDAAKDCSPVGNQVGQSAPSWDTKCWPVCHPGPKFFQSFEAPLVWIAGDQACIDCPDRGADDPVRFDAALVQRLIDAGLVGTERASPLKDQDDLTIIFLLSVRCTL